MLNLACTGRPLGGLIKGKYYLFVGDSASGKTILVLTILAEAANNPHFDNYRLIFDDIEGGALFDMAKFYGRKMASRLEPPRVDKDGAAVYSESVEDVYYNIDNAHQQWKKDGRPFIYFVDSMDSLMTGDDEEHFTKKKKAHEAGTQAKGSFGAAKPKLNSMYLRRLMTPLQKSGSILGIICQTRDSFSMFESKARSGGHALKFYATLEIWTARKQTLKKDYRGEKIPIGILSRMQVKKNRVQGKNRTVTIPIFEQFKNGGGGFDDIGSCIDYLVKMKHWEKKAAKITAPEFEFTGVRDKLVKQIELDGSYQQLQKIVGGVWSAVEEACAVDRQMRYQ